MPVIIFTNADLDKSMLAKSCHVFIKSGQFCRIWSAPSYGLERASFKRPAEVEDIVGGALFLASAHSAYMSGQTLIIDGGKQFI